MTVSISQFQQLKQPLGFITFLSALVVAVVGMQLGKLDTLKADSRTLDTKYLQQESKIRSSHIEVWKKMPGFGFNNMIANLAFMDYLQYFGDREARAVNGYGIGLDYFDVIINKDPKFFYSYYFLSATGSIYTAQPDRSVSLMNQGFKSITPRSPDRSYYLWRLKGIDELLFLGDPKSAQRSMQQAADWARLDGDAEGNRVAGISQQAANFLAKNPSSKEAQFSAWGMVLSTAVDINAQKIAVRKIRELGGKVYLDDQGQVKIEQPPKK
jgi:hypothetical protein